MEAAAVARRLLRHDAEASARMMIDEHDESGIADAIMEKYEGLSDSELVEEALGLIQDNPEWALEMVAEIGKEETNEKHS